MKKYLKLFLIVVSIFVAYRCIPIASADDDPPAESPEGPVEFERLSTKKLDAYCPESGNPNLVSICGRVTQALASPEVLSDGSTAPDVTQVPVKGVSVYLYECDNSSRTCKRDGLLSHPFSSTSTNKDGLFHLLGRKLENTWEHKYPNPYTNNIDLVDDEVIIANQAKKSYLVFSCGGYFQGIHIIPSYMDLTEIVHEVHCPKEFLTADDEEFVYIPPLPQYDFIGGVKLAAHMGIDDTEGYYPTQKGEHIESHTDPQGNVIWDGLETAIQTHYDKYSYKKNQSVQVILKGGDPRFTKPDKDQGKVWAIANAANDQWWDFLDIIPSSTALKGKVPDLGAWYSEDCREQYEGTGWTDYCGATEEELYYGNNGITNEFLLPSIPPKQSLLYYRPLEIRNEISAYYQDQDDLAKYMSSMFQNCMGPVFKRIWEEGPDESNEIDYPDCELLKKCNSVINREGKVNSLTTGGIALAFMAPNALDELEYELIPDIPVCKIEGEDKPVTLKQIQRTGQLSCKKYNPDTGEGMRLCDNGAYWNSYFLTNLGHNNTVTQLTYAGENKEDSFTRRTTEEGELYKTGVDVNKDPFKKTGEGDGHFQTGGQGAVSGGGATESPNAPGGAIKTITTGSDIIVDFLNPPFMDEEDEKEISGGIPYYVSTRPVAWGQFSKTNDYPEQIITSGSHDSGVDIDGDGIREGGYLDPYAFSKEMECKSCAEEHYPEDYLKDVKDIVVQKGKEWGGSRTPFEGVFLTTAAETRNRTLKNVDVSDKWKDKLDSQLSVATGHSYIDWKLINIKREKKDLSDLLREFFTGIFKGSFFGDDNVTERKTFVDRNPVNMPSGRGDDKLGISDPPSITNSNQLNKSRDDEFKVQDELVAYGFKVNESNFTDLFPMPTEACGSEVWDAGCWGNDGGTGCYPWHSLNNESCKTFQPDGMYSRTCRIDTCKSGRITWTFDCTVDSNGNLNEPSNVTTKEDDYYDNQFRCTETTRNKCMETQKKYINGELPPDSPTCRQQGNGFVEIHTYDYCLVARAGPNECDGDILFDAEVQTYSQDIYDQDDDNSPESFVADKIPESGLILQKAFRDPFSEDFAYMPAAWVSVTSSLSETEPDVSLRKDFPGIGIGTSFLTRAQFGQPHPISSKKLEPMYIHCANSDLETEGTWDDGKSCDFATLPDPEVLELSNLENELENIVIEGGDTSCSLNIENISTCESLTIGNSESGEPLKFSETFKLVLNLAGIKFEVEPAAILLYMHKIGADKEYAHYWSEEGEKDLQKVAFPWYGAFPFCDDLEPVKQPPFDLKLTWFYEMFNTAAKPLDTTDSPKQVLNELFGREHTASRCNFIDSIFDLGGSFARSLVKIDVEKGPDGEDILIYTDIRCNEQKWDKYMKEALKKQYYQLEINWNDELKGTLKIINDDYEDLFPSSEYQAIWNACK